jgi:hypothetical protein
MGDIVVAKPSSAPKEDNGKKSSISKLYSNIATESFRLRCSISLPLHFSTTTTKTSQLFEMVLFLKT